MWKLVANEKGPWVWANGPNAAHKNCSSNSLRIVCSKDSHTLIVARLWTTAMEGQNKDTKHVTTVYFLYAQRLCQQAFCGVVQLARGTVNRIEMDHPWCGSRLHRGKSAAIESVYNRPLDNSNYVMFYFLAQLWSSVCSCLSNGTKLKKRRTFALHRHSCVERYNVYQQ